MHDTFKSGLFTDLCQASRFFITYSPSSLKLLQILDKQYKTNFRAKFQANYSSGVNQHHIAYLNTDNQIFITNFSFKIASKMFTFDDTELVIHPIAQPCGGAAAVEPPDEEQVPLFLYPKWERKGRYVLSAIKAFIDKNNYLKGIKFL